MAITVQMKQRSPYTTEGTARTHTVLIDRPEAKGGTDAGMMGGEMLLVALGGCFNSNLLEIIRTRESAIRDVSIDVVGTLEGTPARYTAIEMQIAARYTDRAEIEKYVQMAERACIVANSIGPAIELRFVVMEPTAD